MYIVSTISPRKSTDACARAHVKEIERERKKERGTGTIYRRTNDDQREIVRYLLFTVAVSFDLGAGDRGAGMLAACARWRDCCGS